VCLLDRVMSRYEDEECQNESEVEELRTFVDETDDWINNTLTTLGWTREHVVKVIFRFKVFILMVML